MAYARWQRTIVDEQGNIVPNANIEVRREIPGTPLAVLYEDRDGASGISNPFVAEDNGLAAFHVMGGPYSIRAYKDGFDITWNFVGIGTAGERDFATAFLPRGSWSGATTYAIGDLVSHVSGGEPYAFASNVDDNLNNAPPFSGAIGTSNGFWTVVGLIEAPGEPGEAGSSDVVGTSVTNLAIVAEAKVFTIVESDRGWGIGARLRASSDASPNTHWMEGVVTGYAGNTLNLLVDTIEGSGSRADWTINISGQPGAAAGDVSIREITAAGAVTVTIADEIILLNKAAGAATNINFPAANTYTGAGISIKDIKGDAGTNNATPIFDGAETCDGLTGASFVIDVNYGEQGLFRPLPSGTGWYIHKR